MSADFKVIAFPGGPETALRAQLNEGFPELTSDPVELISVSQEQAVSSVGQILQEAQMQSTALGHFEQHAEQFRTVVPLKEKSTSVRLMVEEGTGARLAVVPATFLVNLGRQMIAVRRGMSQEDALRNSSRVSQAYALGLLAYEEIDPWRLGENPLLDTVSANLARGLLCTGIDDGTQELPPKLIPHYMRHTLSKRFATAIAYLDFQKALTEKDGDESAARSFLESFIERRMTAVHHVRHDGLLAVSDIDHAFAYPLAREDMRSFTFFASLLSVRGIMRQI